LEDTEILWIHLVIVIGIESTVFSCVYMSHLTAMSTEAGAAFFKVAVVHSRLFGDVHNIEAIDEGFGIRHFHHLAIYQIHAPATPQARIER
jgi:hypothetical protein